MKKNNIICFSGENSGEIVNAIANKSTDYSNEKYGDLIITNDGWKFSNSTTLNNTWDLIPITNASSYCVSYFVNSYEYVIDYSNTLNYNLYNSYSYNNINNKVAYSFTNIKLNTYAHINIDNDTVLSYYNNDKFSIEHSLFKTYEYNPNNTGPYTMLSYHQQYIMQDYVTHLGVSGVKTFIKFAYNNQYRFNYDNTAYTIQAIWLNLFSEDYNNPVNMTIHNADVYNTHSFKINNIYVDNKVCSYYYNRVRCNNAIINEPTTYSSHSYSHIIIPDNRYSYIVFDTTNSYSNAIASFIVDFICNDEPDSSFDD